MIGSKRTLISAEAQSLKAHDASDSIEQALELAEEMRPMTGVQQKRFVEEIKDKPINEAIEDAKSGSKVIQVIATITLSTHAALRKFADDKDLKQDEAVVALIEKALTDEGLLE